MVTNMKKKLLLSLTLLTINLSVFAVEPVTVVSDIPAQTKEMADRIDSMIHLQTLINAVAKARNVQEQVKQLQNIANFQKDPAHAVDQVNQAVTNLVNTFNSQNSTNFNNLSQLIGALSSSSSSMSMSVKMAQVSNMQLMSIQNILEQLRAQQNALIAYKQAEQAQKKAQEDAFRADIEKSRKYNRDHPSW